MAKKLRELRAKDEENLQLEREDAERGKINLAEAYIVVAFSVIADVLDVVAGLSVISVVGIAIGLIAKLGSFFIKGSIILWAFVRHAHGRYLTRRFISTALGNLTDEVLTLGLLPITTLTSVIVIWMNNHFSKQTIQRVEKLLAGRL